MAKMYIDQGILSLEDSIKLGFINSQRLIVYVLTLKRVLALIQLYIIELYYIILLFYCTSILERLTLHQYITGRYDNNYISIMYTCTVYNNVFIKLYTRKYSK